jgi:hypothetical protein
MPEAARGVLDTYLAIPSKDRGTAEFANALQSLRELGPSGVPAILELLATLSPCVAEEMCGPEWEENAAWHVLREVAEMGSGAMPGVLGQAESDSDEVRAFAYMALSLMEFDGHDVRIRAAVMRGVGDSHRGARNAAVGTLAKVDLPPTELLDALTRACEAAPTGDTAVIALEGMAEVGLRDAVPFVRSVARANHPEGDDEVLAAAVTTLAMLDDWELEETMLELARRSPVHPSSFDFYTSPGPVARWALARKAGYDYPRWTPGCGLADVWWKLEGERSYDPNTPQVPVDYGEPVNGLVAGIHADSDVLRPFEWFHFDVVVRNVTDHPVRIMIGAPVGGGTGPFFRPVPEVVSRHGKVSWREGGYSGSSALVTVPPGGIAGVPVSFAPYGFDPSLSPGDAVRLSVDYTHDGGPGDPETVWKGTTRSGPLVLKVREPLRR